MNNPVLLSAWRVTVPGHKPFIMTGEACTQAEALEFARGIWPDAEVSQ